MTSIASKARNIPYWLGSIGWRGTLTYAAYRTKEAFGLPNPSFLRLKPRLAKYPVVVGAGGSSDMCVFAQVFQRDEYACMRRISSPQLIVDLGANVGYSSAYFLSCFPAAKVVAVEPDPDNYGLCCTNLAPYGDRARVVLGAAWSKRSRLALSRGHSGDGRGWASQVFASSDGEASVDGWDILSLLEMAGGGSIDILKVDIERSELEVFDSGASSWLPRIRNICIELHGADCEEVFFHALEGFHYDLEHSGELTVCLNIHGRP
jgi:FkbM family methyltransferase